MKLSWANTERFQTVFAQIIESDSSASSFAVQCAGERAPSVRNVLSFGRLTSSPRTVEAQPRVNSSLFLPA